MFALIVFCALGFAEDSAVRIGTMSDPAIREASGIVKSRAHPGVYWVHNDSGNPPALFAVREDGTLIRRYEIAATNLDWEDVAADDRGHLFLGDIGNNGGVLPIRAIYRIDEPDPAVEPAGPLPVTLGVHYKVLKTDRFDAESLVIDGDVALLVTKRFDGRDARLKSIPLDASASLFRPAMTTDLGSLPGFVEPATGADLSQDGRRLAVVSLAKVRVYERDGDRWTLIGEAGFRGNGVEAIAWDGDDLILAGEGRGVYRIAAKSWRSPRKRGSKR